MSMFLLVFPGMHCQLLLNGYNSNSQSPSDNAMLAKSPASTNQDDEEDLEPHSPVPLSLTTNRSPSPANKEPPSPAVDTTQVSPPVCGSHFFFFYLLLRSSNITSAMQISLRSDPSMPCLLVFYYFSPVH